jgi:DNA repair protein RecO (recombination protein O)
VSRGAEVEAIVLRSLRYGEADRVLHLLTREQGRLNAIAKGARRTTSRLGGRLEPLSRVALFVRRGSGDLGTVTGADLLDGGDAVRADPGRLALALAGAEAVLKLFPEAAANDRLFDGFVRYLALVAERPAGAPADPATDPLALAFLVKLVALAGWAPRADACAACGGPGPLPRFDADAGGLACAACGGGFALAPDTPAALRDLLAQPLGSVVPGMRALRDVARIVDETSRAHAGVRLRSIA